MSWTFNDLDSARTVIRKAATASRTSLTAASDAAGLSRGSITRFVSGRGQRQNTDPDIYLSTMLRLLDFLGYEIVVRKKAGNGRARLLAAVQRENREDERQAS